MAEKKVTDELDDIDDIPAANSAKIKRPRSGKRIESGVAAPQPEISDESDTTERKERKRRGKKESREMTGKHGRGRRGRLLVLLLVFALLIGAIVAVVGFNIFGLRDRYLNDILRNVPIVRNIIPPKEEAAEGEQLDEASLIKRVAELENQIESLESENESVNGKLLLSMDEIDRLKPFEEQQREMKQAKEDYDREVVLGNTSAYQKYFESINPDLAAELYQQAVGINITVKELKNYVNAYSAMEPNEAAKIFNELTATDLDLICLILKNMTPEARGAILAQMTAVNAAAVTKRMAPAASEAPVATEASGQ